MDFMELFRQSMLTDGIKTDVEITPNGKIHRFHIEGDTPRSLNGWYILYSCAMYSGAYGCWKRGIKKSWCSKSKEYMTSIEWNLHQERIHQTQKELSELRKTAKENAKTLWEQSRVFSYGLRIDKKNHLIVPVYNSDSEIFSLQFIAPTGEKRFLKGGNIAGGYYFIGNQKPPTDIIYISEGYATCASIHDATNFAVVCCFNCNNILKVARLIRNRFPQAELIIAADNDTYTPGNPGLLKGKDAAKHVAAHLVYPDFTGLNLESKPTDFNDLMRLSDINRVKINLMHKQNKEV
jgi:putative DNA primase/helicase